MGKFQQFLDQYFKENYKRFSMIAANQLRRFGIRGDIFDLQTKFPNLKTKEDFVLWLKILQKNIFIGSLNETLSSWRKLDNSLSSSVLQKIKDAFKVYNYYMQFNFIKSFYYVICLSINFLKK